MGNNGSLPILTGYDMKSDDKFKFAFMWWCVEEKWKDVILSQEVQGLLDTHACVRVLSSTYT